MAGVDAIERNRRRAHAAKMHTLDLKTYVHQVKSNPCEDCGQRYPAECMDFDHRPGEAKVLNVARMLSSRTTSLEGIKAEIAKCDLVCANCHRIRTAERRDD